MTDDQREKLLTTLRDGLDLVTFRKLVLKLRSIEPALDPDDLGPPGHRKTDLIIDLIEYFEKRDRFDELNRYASEFLKEGGGAYPDGRPGIGPQLGKQSREFDIGPLYTKLISLTLTQLHEFSGLLGIPYGDLGGPYATRHDRVAKLIEKFRQVKPGSRSAELLRRAQDLDDFAISYEARGREEDAKGARHQADIFRKDALQLENDALQSLDESVSLYHQGVSSKSTQVAAPDTIRLTFSEICEACRDQVNRNRPLIGQKLLVSEQGTELYVKRAVEDDLDAFLNASGRAYRNCFLLIASAGSGKTLTLFKLAQRRALTQPVLLLLAGSITLDKSLGFLPLIQRELALANSRVQIRHPEDVLAVLHDYAEANNCDAVLCIDAINECTDPIRIHKALVDLIKLTHGKRIKLVITCRDFYWGFFQDPIWEGASLSFQHQLASSSRFRLFEPDELDDAMQSYFRHYAIKGWPGREAKAKCRQPLLLRFFCEAYQGKEVGHIKDIRLKELFDEYWKEKLVSISQHRKADRKRDVDADPKETETYLLALADQMLRTDSQRVPFSQLPLVRGKREIHGDPHSLFTRIHDEDIILEQREDTVAFVYEEFMEYVMALSLTSAWKQDGLTDTEVLYAVETLIERHRDFTQILGVLLYLALMLNERGLGLWSFLFRHGHVGQTVLLEGARKLGEGHLDQQIVGLLAALLATANTSIVSQTLDTLSVRHVAQVVPVEVAAQVYLLSHQVDPSLHPNIVEALRAMPASRDVAPDLAFHFLRRRLPSREATALLDERGEYAYASSMNALLYADTHHLPPKQHLETLQRDEALDFLARTIHDVSPVARMDTAKALGIIANPRCVPMLRTLLRDSNWEVREKAAYALGRLRDPSTIGDLARVCNGQEPSAHVRGAVKRALTAIGTLEALEAAANCHQPIIGPTRIPPIQLDPPKSGEPR